eukprot:GAHX01000611.1.p1 GENE.GAHX01000611.1~~GAHX01000611.1.p1  ORF type:complete len:195 (-),score=35.47 GAHX01000611.1:27-611(-)
MKLIFVTGNEKKLEETRAMLVGHEIVSYKLDLEELQGTREEISKRKCQIAFNRIKESGKFDDLDSCLVLIEDSSFYVDEYFPLPGVYVKEFLKLEPAKFLEMFSHGKNRSVTAYCSFAISNGKHIRIIEGCLKGKLVEEARGNRGFGWDPYLIPVNETITVAEMSFAKKNSISQRCAAVKKLKTVLENPSNIFK